MKTPFALRHYPGVLLVVIVAAALVALTTASPPLASTAVASAALKNKLAEVTPLGAGLAIRRVAELPAGETPARAAASSDRRARELERLAAGLKFVGTPLATTLTVPIDASSPRANEGATVSVRLMDRPGALAHVKVISQIAGPGIWISNLTANQLHVGPGNRIALEAATQPGATRRVTLRVKGIYRALAYGPEAPFWVNFHTDVYPQDLDDPPPSQFALTSRDEIFRVGHALGGVDFDDIYEIPLRPGRLTVADARRLDHQLDAIRLQVADTGSPVARALGCTRTGYLACMTSSLLSGAVTLAETNLDAVSPTVTLLADAGTAITLIVAAAAGVFLVRRRRGEASLLYARGVSAPSFAGRTAVEAVLPSLVGGAAGFGLALALTSLFAPSGTIDNATMVDALGRAAVGVAAALLLLASAAAVAFSRLYDTGRGTRTWLRFVPWELPLLGVGIYLLLTIRSGGGLAPSGLSGQHHPTLAVFVSPLLLAAGVAGLAARLGRHLLRRYSTRGRSLPTPVFLAVRRLAAARGLVVALAVVSSVALTAFFFSETLAASLRRTAAEKAYIATGSDVQGTIADSEALPKNFPFPLTRVQIANQSATVGSSIGRQVDVMLVDPKTLDSTLHWQSDWGPNPAPLLAGLERSSAGRLPVVVTSGLAHTSAIFMSGRRFPVRVLGTVSAFPGMSAGVPLVIAPLRALTADTAKAGLFQPLGVLWTYVWGKGPPTRVASALASSPLHPYFVSTTQTFRRNPDVLLATRTFAFLRAVAVGAGLLVLIGLLLYLQARQRSQTIASALARRMGLRRSHEIASVCLELAAIVVFAAVVGGALAVVSAGLISRHIDPLPQYAPAAAFSVPTLEIVAASGAILVLMVAAASVTSWLAGRTDVAEAFRDA